MTHERIGDLLGGLMAGTLGLLGLAGLVIDVAVGRPRDLRLARDGRRAAAVVTEAHRSYVVNVGRVVNVHPAVSLARIDDGPWRGREFKVEAGIPVGQRVELVCLPDPLLCESAADLAERLARWPATATNVISGAFLAAGALGCCVWARRSRHRLPRP